MLPELIKERETNKENTNDVAINLFQSYFEKKAQLDN